MMAKPKQEDALSILLVAKWEEIANKLATLAGEFPEEKFESRPVDDVRTCGDVLRHVAFWNQYVADTLSGKKADDSSNELSRTRFATKARIVEALERSSHEAVVALKGRQSDVDPKTVELMVSFIEHTCEHYGQLAVYSRLMGIVPPASRA